MTGPTSPEEEAPRFVVHLPVLAADLPAAKTKARTLARSLAFLPEFDGGETTVSEEDEQCVRHRVLCDRLLAPGRRCALPADHAGLCTPDHHP